MTDRSPVRELVQWTDGLESASGSQPTWAWEGDDWTSSTNDSDDSEGDGGEISEGEHYWEVPFLTTVCAFGVIGNMMVVAVYSKKSFRTSNASLYVLNLAAGDLFLLVFVVAFHITEYYPSTWPILWRHDAQCILHRYGRFVGFNVTIFTMVAIAIDRYMAVCHALVFRTRCTLAKTRLCILLVWVLAAATATPCVINFGVKYQAGVHSENYIGKTPFACRPVFISTFYLNFKIIYISVILFWVPVLITAATYTAVVIFVRHNNMKFQKCTSAGRHLRSHWKATRTLLMIFCVYVLSYVFLATYTLVRQYAIVDVNAVVKNVGLLLPYANSCVNPVVYSFVNLKFRKACWQMLCSSRQKTRAQSTPDVRNGGSCADQQGEASLSLSSSWNKTSDKTPVGIEKVNVGTDPGLGEGVDNFSFKGDMV